MDGIRGRRVCVCRGRTIITRVRRGACEVSDRDREFGLFEGIGLAAIDYAAA